MEDEDLALAQALQAQYDAEDAHEEMKNFVPEEFRFAGTPTKKFKLDKSSNETSIVAPEWEDLDPTPDLHALFLQFNTKFFWDKLHMCEVKWSPRMTLCAGVCSYQRRSGYCSIRLSVPLLKLRPRKDLVETLLHEMIHAFLFVTDGDDDHDGHGPAFHSHMFRINKEAGTKISVYHNFHDEVEVYRQHWWKCNGPCQKRPPFFGLVKRTMNRKPGPYDRWWAEHQANCGGTYIKIKEPEGFGQKKSKSSKTTEMPKGQKDIRSFVSGSEASKPTKAKGLEGPSAIAGKGGGRGNIFGFGGTSFSSPSSSGTSSGGLKTAGKVGAFVVGQRSKVEDNSSEGHVIKTGKDSTSTTTTTATASGASSSEGTVGGTLDSSPASVRQKLREFWSSKSSNASSSTKENVQCGAPSSTATKTVDPKPMAPNATSNAEKKKGATSVASSASLFSQKSRSDESGKTNGSPPDTKSTCPVCNKSIPDKEINAHLDVCLQNPPDKDSNAEVSSKKIESGDCPVCGREILLDEMNEHLDFCIGSSH